MAEPFREQVAVTGWVDGDTVRGVIDQGFGLYRGRALRVVPAGYVANAPQVIVDPLRLRIAKINTPELGQPGAGEATDFAAALFPPGVHSCETFVLDEYGRPLVDPITRQGARLSDAIIAAGLAQRYQLIER